MVVVAERLQSLVAGLGQRLVAVAELHAPQARHAVDDLLAFGVPEVNALAARDDAHAFLVQRRGVGKGMDVMGGVERLPMLGLVAAVRGHVARTPDEERDVQRSGRAHASRRTLRD